MTKKVFLRLVFLPIVILFAVTGCKTKSSYKSSEAIKNYSLLVFVGTYTQKESWVDGKAKGIYIYQMNPQTGELKYVSTSPSTISPSFVVVHPNKKWLYAANELGVDGKIVGCAA